MNTYILSAKRTPIGCFMGALSSVPAPQLGAQVIKALLSSHQELSKNSVEQETSNTNSVTESSFGAGQAGRQKNKSTHQLGGSSAQSSSAQSSSAQSSSAQSSSAQLSSSVPLMRDIGECIMGQVLTAGSGQAPARQSALFAGLDHSVPCMTINKVCGSGLKAILLAQDSISLGKTDVVLAGGQENMSLSPYLLAQLRVGVRLGHGQAEDSLIKDGLWDPYHDCQMGQLAEICAKDYKISREQQDDFAVKSYKKALKAQEQGFFQEEIIPVCVSAGKKSHIVSEDEEPGRARFEKISKLRPVFEKEGSITPANASKINDGASACVLISEHYMKSEKQKPLARMIAQGVCAQAPEHFTTAPIQAIQESLRHANLKLSDIDFFEINEAFSVVALAVSKELGIPEEKLNPHGGAVALGHPIGASGARILTTLVHALHRHNKKRGVAAICLGGGEALSLVVEKV